MTAILLSQKLLHAVKSAKPVHGLLNELAEKSETRLAADLMNVACRKACWMNLYNAFVQIAMEEQQPDLRYWKSRLKFFGNRSIRIAGHLLSLNDIEHGMLRDSSVWWSFGYLKKIFISDFEKKFRTRVDFRVHFALNCGAFSCPAIQSFSSENINEELDALMNDFLLEETSFDISTGTVQLPAIFKWYIGDFGGTNGIKRLLMEHGIVPSINELRLQFKPYDWTALPGKYRRENKVL